MSSPEGAFPLEIDYTDAVTKRQILLLGISIMALLEAHENPDNLYVEVVGDVDQHRIFPTGGYLAPKGFVPELSLQRDGDLYNFRSLLVHPSGSAAGITANRVEAMYSSADTMNITKVERLFIPRADVNGKYIVRRPAQRELKASTVISCVAVVTDRLSRETSVVRWLS